MARIRSIHPGQWTDEAFVSVSFAARLLAIALRNEADDWGLFEWRPARLRMRLFPCDDVDVAALLDELERVDLVRRYEVDGRTYGAIRNFCRWQTPKKPRREHPITTEIAEYVGASARQSDRAQGRSTGPTDAGHSGGLSPEPVPHEFGTSSEPVPDRFPVGEGEGEGENREHRNQSQNHKHTQESLLGGEGGKGGYGGKRGNARAPCARAAPPPPSTGGVPKNDNARKRPAEEARGSRLPADWQPSPKDIEFAVKEGLSHDAIQRESEKFRDYWHAATGQHSRKRDWSAAWRNWIRKAADDLARARPGRGAAGGGGAGRERPRGIIAATAELIAEYEAKMAGVGRS